MNSFCFLCISVPIVSDTMNFAFQKSGIRVLEDAFTWARRPVVFLLVLHFSDFCFLVHVLGVFFVEFFVHCF